MVWHWHICLLAPEHFVTTQVLDAKFAPHFVAGIWKKFWFGKQLHSHFVQTKGFQTLNILDYITTFQPDVGNREHIQQHNNWLIKCFLFLHCSFWLYCFPNFSENFGLACWSFFSIYLCQQQTPGKYFVHYIFQKDQTCEGRSSALLWNFSWAFLVFVVPEEFLHAGSSLEFGFPPCELRVHSIF